jgi:hypothetical protein
MMLTADGADSVEAKLPSDRELHQLSQGPEFIHPHDHTGEIETEIPTAGPETVHDFVEEIWPPLDDEKK